MFTLGLDGLDITINTDVKLEQNHYTFKNQAGKELGNLAAVKNGYKLHLFLSKENDCRRKASALYTGGNKIHY